MEEEDTAITPDLRGCPKYGKMRFVRICIDHLFQSTGKKFETRGILCAPSEFFGYYGTTPPHCTFETLAILRAPSKLFWYGSASKISGFFGIQSTISNTEGSHTLMQENLI